MKDEWILNRQAQGKEKKEEGTAKQMQKGKKEEAVRYFHSSSPLLDRNNGTNEM